MAEAVFSGGQLAVQLTQMILSCPAGPTPEMRITDALKNIHVQPLDRWNDHVSGKVKLSYGNHFICGPKRGIGMTVDPHNAAHLEFIPMGDGYHAIKLNGKYLFAGDQATVKWGKTKIGEWERFQIRSTVIDNRRFCTIKCKRDGEYWYIDNEGMVRHRLRKEDGFKIHVFFMQYV